MKKEYNTPIMQVIILEACKLFEESNDNVATDPFDEYSPS